MTISPPTLDKSDVASIIIALFHVMPSQFVSEMLDMSETLRLNETTRPLNLLFKTFQSFLNGDEAFPPAWPALHILAHRTVLKVMGPIGESLMKTVGYVLQNPRLEYARLQVDLTSYFRTLLLLLNSNWVQVENFGPQHSRVAKEVGADIREAGGKLLEHVWSSLARMEVGSVSKSTPATTNGNAEAFTSLFTPHLIGSFMELTLSPHTELKAIAINLMFGAIEREFEKNGNLNFAEAECIDRLERLIMGDSKGNTEYRQWLIESLQAKLRQWIRRGQQDCPPPALTVDKKRMSSISSCASSADVFSSLKIGGFAQAARSFIEDVSTFLDLCIVVRSIIEPPVVLNAPETNCLKPTVSSPPASHDGQIFAILKLMRFVRTIGHRGIYVKYAHRLSNIHLGKNRPVEAALALKLHADVLDWSMDINVEPLLEYNFPRTQTAFDRKSEILQNVVLLLERGCAWERAYEVLKELSVRYERGIGINYGQLADIYQHQSSLLRKIWGQSSSEAGINNNSTRFPPTYYRVYFHGGPWPDHLRGHQFVYKAGEWERLPAFIERIMNEYPDAQLYRNNGPVDLEISNGQVKFLQITAVKPEIDLRRWFNSDGMVGWPLLWENGDARSIGDWYRSDSVTDCIEMAVPLLILEPDLETQPDGIGIKTLSYLEKMPDQIKEYLMYNEVNLFTHSRPIKRTVAPNELSDIIEGPALEFSQLWTEKTLLITSDNFPCLSDKSLVVETINYDISPIENAIISVKGKNRQLLELEKKYSSQSHQAPLNMNPFTMALTGSVDAPVNGGIPMYRIAFLNGRPKTPLVTLLERSINDQVNKTKHLGFEKNIKPLHP